MPILVIDPMGDLFYFNEPAESILGRRFDETGEMRRGDWPQLLKTSDEYGTPIKEEERPMLAALHRGEPSHRRMWLRGLDGMNRKIEGTALPLRSLDGENLGVLGIFWEIEIGGERHTEVLVPVVDSPHLSVEVILTRRLASGLSSPIFLVGADGRLLYFNQAAEKILGKTFEDAKKTTLDALYASFSPVDEDNQRIEHEEHPLAVARLKGRPMHRRYWISGLDGIQRQIEVTAIPLTGQSERLLGVFGVFWEIGNS